MRNKGANLTTTSITVAAKSKDFAGKKCLQLRVEEVTQVTNKEEDFFSNMMTKS